MKCDVAQEQMVLLMYGELDDELAIGLEQHLDECDGCQSELSAIREMDEDLALVPVVEVSPNLLAQSRMRLDEALDGESPHGLMTRVRASWWRWTGFLTGAPALATLLLGVGFLGGDFTHRYKEAHAPKPPQIVIYNEQTKGVIANVSGIVQTPNSELVQVKYNRVVPETMEGSLDSPEIRQLLMMGMRAGTSEGVRTDAVGLMAHECRVGHACAGTDEGRDVRGALMVRLRYDSDAGVRMQALHGLERYVDQDQRVRDAVLEALMHDKSASVRTAAIGMLAPVQSDSSVRQVLRTVSTQDESPFIRTASYEALQSASEIQ
ncbi:MAG: hypothetical protein NVSMB3_14380 [Acidobacteriaceae bacterium]